MNKLFDIDDLNNALKKHKKSKPKIVLAHGVFDVLHIGHVKYFNKAKSLGDLLIVSLTSDKFVNKGPGRPYFNQNLRAEFIENISCVDYVVINNSETSENIIEKLKPNIYVKGNDYKDLIKTDKNLINEINILKRNKGRIFIINEILFSSSKIINQNFDHYKKNHIPIIDKLKKRDVEKDLSDLKNKRVLVVGDEIIDEFTFVRSLGKSRKNNIISTRYLNKESQKGGALFIYENLNQYFKKCDFFSFLSTKDLSNNLIKPNRNLLFKTQERQLIFKNRFVDFYNNNKIFQINSNDQLEISSKERSKIASKLKETIPKYDYLIICDFGHGFFKGPILKTINSSKIKKIINCQTNSSNFGFNKFDKFSNASILTCDEDEFRLSVGEETINIQNLLKKNKFPYGDFIVTSGKNGCFLKNKDFIFFVESFDIKNFVDSIGSGDVFFSYYILCSMLKYSYPEKILLSHLAAALHSQSFANREIVSSSKFLKSLKTISS